MAFWKKILIVLGSIIGVFALLFLIFYLTYGSLPEPELRHGEYVLVQASVTQDEIETKLEIDDSKLIVGEKLTMKATTNGVGVVSGNYTYALHDREVMIFPAESNEVSYGGFYNNASIEIRKAEDGKLYKFIYQLKEKLAQGEYVLYEATETKDETEVQLDVGNSTILVGENETITIKTTSGKGMISGEYSYTYINQELTFVSNADENITYGGRPMKNGFVIRKVEDGKLIQLKYKLKGV